MSVERLADLLRHHQPAVALTGAGVSTESGIPDFRSPTGLWATVDPREYASVEAFERDPERVWSFYRRRISMLLDARPNRAHRALAELERLGFLEALVTQNIDLLHSRAGSREVVEVHGSIRTAGCPRCGCVVALEGVRAQLDASERAPRCPACSSVLKPDVVFFGELLPEQAIDRAYELARRARLLLVVGSSLEVWPVAELPSVTARAGGAVAIVDLGETSYDRQATLKVEAPAGDVLEAVVRAVGGSLS